MTLLGFDPLKGTLTEIAGHPFERVLPEGGSYDLSGRHFLATVFQYRDGLARGGGLEVLRVRRGSQPGLERLGRLALPHGVHQIDVAR